MNGIHDMGGMDGFGAVRVEANEAVFHAPWEGRVFAMAGLVLAAGVSNPDAFRHAIECMAPAEYLAAGYYGRWLAALERQLVDAGVLTRRELTARLGGRTPRHGRGGAKSPRPAPLPPPSAASVLPPDGAAPVPRPRAQRGALRTITTPPRFAVGQAVRARNLNPPGHTRLPRYVRGRRGTIALLHPAWVFPDTNAHGLGEHPQYAYSVRFAARELWGDTAEPRACVHVDLFESYLEPA